MAASASSLLVKRCPLSVLFKVGKSGSHWALGRDCRGCGPGSLNWRWQYGWLLLLPCGISHCCAGWFLLWEGQVSQPALPPLSTIAVHVRLPCLLGTHCSVVLSLTQHCVCTACAMKVVCPTTNEEGCLWTQSTGTLHSLYAVPGNKMGKLISRLFYVVKHYTMKTYGAVNV
jgi:hypothetical protein